MDKLNGVTPSIVLAVIVVLQQIGMFPTWKECDAKYATKEAQQTAVEYINARLGKIEDKIDLIIKYNNK